MRRRYNILLSIVTTAVLTFGGLGVAAAQCVLPYQLTNGQTADASQVMADLNALAACLSNAPGGPANAIQYNTGTGSFGGVGPLSNGQLVIGSTGAAPQAQTLTAGSGVSITNGGGSITISTTGAAGAGLYNQVMSATPTTTNTGFGELAGTGATQTNTPIGIALSGTNGVASYQAVPTPPYSFKALLVAFPEPSGTPLGAIGWTDGTKYHLIRTDTTGDIHVQRFSSISSFASEDFRSARNQYWEPNVWLKVYDDGVTVHFYYSKDGVQFAQVYSVAKTSGYLSSYANVFFGNLPNANVASGVTLLSWTRGTN